MKILLAIPADEHLIHREAVIPLGIAYINGALREEGFDVISCNLNYVEGEVEDYLRRTINNESIDVFLCGGTSYNYHSMKNLFRMVKSISNNIITVGGGVGYTAQPYLFPQMTNPDYVVLGEGEGTMCELMHALEAGKDITEIPGIMYKQGNQYVATESRPLITNVSEIAYPSYEGFGVDLLFEDLNNYDESSHYDYETVRSPRVLPILFGRSCPYECKFCFHTIGRKYRARTLDDFFGEVEFLIQKYDITGLTIMDEFFGVNKKTILEFCSRIKKYNLKWFAELRVDAVDAETLKAMKDAGCTNVLFGLESMNPQILQEMKKHISVSQIENALEIAYNSGLTISGNFIVGSPLETMETFFKTFDWWNTHRKYQIDFVHLQLYPGTEYYKAAVESGHISDEKLFIEMKMPEINISQLDNYEWDKVRRIVRLTRIDNVMNGKCTVKEIDGSKQLHLKCRHCGSSFVRPFNVSRLWDKIVYKCPVCEHKSTYTLNDENITFFENEIYKQYSMNCAFDKKMRIKSEYKKVVLVGNGHNLVLMLAEMEKNGVCVVGIADEDITKLLRYKNNIFTQPIISLSDIVKQKDVDTVILCCTVEYNQYVNSLRKSGYVGKIDSMVNMILQHDYFIEENVW